ncbi:MAG: S8 family serine peptidase [Clostridiaceae bacterium]|nr:S8 family serine peptidase [Clostridiaceae bacterium]
MKRKRLTRPLSVLLSVMMLLGMFSMAAPAQATSSLGENPGSPPTETGISSRYLKTLPDIPEVESVDISDQMWVDVSKNLDLSETKAAGAASESSEEAYIEAVAEMLANPVGALGFEGVDQGDMVDVIVWLQEMPTALAEAYGKKEIPFASAYASAAVKARQTIKASFSGSITFEYSEVFSGFAMSVPASKVQALGQMSGVYAVIPDTLMYADFTADPDYEFTGMKESREAFDIAEIHEAGITGDGVIVGVLDTGIDYNHPDLENVYKGGWNFITAAADNNVRNRADNDPMETTYVQWQASGQPETNSSGHEYYTSHGTHVSGTIAAQAENGTGTYKTLGLAPDVDLYVARVLGPYGSGATSGIIAAIDDFAEDGGHLPKADVINLSLGADSDTAYGADVYALNNAVIAGVNVAVSAGNNAGSDTASRDTYTLGTPGTAYLPVTVAASQYGGTEIKTYDAVTAAAGEATDTFGLLLEGMDIRNTFSDNTIGGTPAPVYVEGQGYEVYLAFGPNDTNPTLADLQAIPDGSLAGKILVVKRGLNFTDFLAQAKRTGAGALIIVNSAAKGENYITNMAIGGANVDHMPIFSAYHSTSAKLTALAQSGAVYLQLGTLTTSPQAYEPAYFSSIGPVTETVGLKPDITAPGWSIVSTQPAFITDPDHDPENYDGAYASMSGTSMSAPHMTGILALMKEKYPSATPAELKARLMNTADPDLIMALPDGTPASVFEVGAGFVDPYRAIMEDTAVYVTVADHIPGQNSGSWIEGQTLSSLNFGTVEAGSESGTLPVTVHGAEEFTVSVVYNDDTRYSLSSAVNGVTLETGEAANGTFNAWVSIPEDAGEGLYEGYLVVTAGENSYVVPWAVSTGAPAAAFSAEYILSERPIISTTTDTGIRASAYANATTLFFQYTGDGWPTGSADIILLSADLNAIPYYYGTLNLASASAGSLYRVTSALGYQAYAVNDEGNIASQKTTIADGAYYVAMTAGESIWYGSGVVFTNGAPTFTTDPYIEIASDAEELTFSGTLYSEAAALATEMGFTWDDPDYVLEGYSFPVDQSWNALAFSANSGAGAVLSVGGSAYICNEDGEFELIFSGISDEARELWDYLLTNGSNHALIGVDAYGYNYVSSGWVQHSNAKSTPMTVTYGVVNPYALPAIETVGVRMDTLPDRTLGIVSVNFANSLAELDPENLAVSVTNNGLAVTGLAFLGVSGNTMTWKFDLSPANVAQFIGAEVVYEGQTYGANCVIEASGEPLPLLTDVQIENGVLTATLSNAPYAMVANDFTLAFCLEDEPYDVGETTYSYSCTDGMATVIWTFNPIASSIYDRVLAADVTYANTTLRGETVLEKVLPEYNYQVALGVDSLNVSVGDTLALNVFITGEEAYSGYDITVAFDDAHLLFDGISDQDAMLAEDNGTVRFFKAGDQVEIGEEPVVTLYFTIMNTVTGSQPVTFTVTNAEVTNAGNPDDDSFVTTIGAPVTAAAHNLTVTFRAGTGVVDFGTQTAYVRYNQAGLFTDSTYTEAFVIPTLEAQPGYQIVPPVWYDGTISHWQNEIVTTAFTANAEFTAMAEAINYGFAVIPEGAIEDVTGLTVTDQATHDTDITFHVASLLAGNDLMVSYSIGNGEWVVLTAEEGVYTIPGAEILGKVTVRVTMTIEGEVTYHTFNGAPNDYKLALLSVEIPVPGATYTIDGKPIFWAGRYLPEVGAYAYIVPTDWTEQDFYDRLSYMIYTEEGEAVSRNVPVSYDGDVNRNGKVNLTDAQITYDLYNGNLEYLNDNLTLLPILSRLEADMNADITVNMLDVRAIYTVMLQLPQ